MSLRKTDNNVDSIRKKQKQREKRNKVIITYRNKQLVTGLAASVV